MFISLCTHTCVCIYICVCLCVYTYICMCIDIYIYIYICMYVCMYVCMCVYIYVCMCVCVYIYICVCVCVCVVPSISFRTFFVQAFKIVIDSWKFSILLLYILWDDWPIFRILRSNERLQQELTIHPTKAWLSQLVNFKNAIWTWGHFRRMICNKILF